MRNFFTQKVTWSLFFSVITIIVGFGCWGYGIYHYAQTLAKLDETTRELSDRQIASQERMKGLEDRLASLEGANSNLMGALKTEQEKTGSTLEQIGQISNTVGVLSKLSKTDPELLKKYSKAYFLNEHYVPLSLATIDSQYLSNPKATLQIHASVWPYLQRLLVAGQTNGMHMQILSAYRSFGTQAVLKSAYRITYGAGTANAFSAEQGYSEHQLGTTIDFTTPAIGSALTGFDKTSEYQWLLDNAYQYGFVISYPKENTFYTFEPWHWRFVGVALATRLHQSNQYFYAMDQREIDNYLANIFD